MGGRGEEIWGAKHVFPRVGPTSGMEKRNIILLHQFGSQDIEEYFARLNSGKLSKCTVEEHYCLRLVQSRIGLAQRMLEDVDQRVLTVKGAQAPSSSLRLLEKNIRSILVKYIEY